MEQNREGRMQCEDYRSYPRKIIDLTGERFISLGCKITMDSLGIETDFYKNKRGTASAAIPLF